MTVFSNQIAVTFEVPKTKKPPDRPFHLFVDSARCIRHLEYFAGSVSTSISHAFDTEIARSSIALGISAESHDAVQRCTRLTTDFYDYSSISQIVFAVRLWIGRRIYVHPFQVVSKRLKVYVRRRRIQNCSLFRKQIAECVVEFLKFRR